jgi:tetratricopeptide (TPR) repeat protein
MFTAQTRGHADNRPRTPLRRVGALAVAIGLTACIVGAQLQAEEAPEKPAPITEAEARAFAQVVSKAIADQDLQGWMSFCDWASLVDAATAEPADPKLDNVRSLFRKRVMSNFSSPLGWMSQTLAAAANGLDYKCIRVVTDVPEPYVLFRLRFQPTGINHHRYFLTRDRSGSVVAKDMYVLVSGERQSDGIRRAWKVAVEAKNAGGDRINSVLEMAAFSRMVAQGLHAEALKKYRQLTPEAQRDKNILMARYEAASEVSDEEAQAAVLDIRKYHPQDTALDVLLIDVYIEQKKYDDALKSIDRLRESTGDPYFDVQRAIILCKQERLKDARVAVERAIRAEPDLPDAYLSAIEVSLSERKFDEVVRLLTKLEQLGQQLNDLSKLPEYAQFVKSPEYAEWMKARQKQPAP